MNRHDCCGSYNYSTQTECSIPKSVQPHPAEHEAWTAWGAWSGDPRGRRVGPNWPYNPTVGIVQAVSTGRSSSSGAQQALASQSLCCQAPDLSGRVLCTIPLCEGYHFRHENFDKWGMSSKNSPGELPRKTWPNNVPPPALFSKNRCCGTTFDDGGKRFFCTIPIDVGYHSTCEDYGSAGHYGANSKNRRAAWPNSRSPSYYHNIKEQLEPAPIPEPVFETNNEITDWDLLEDAENGSELPSLDDLYKMGK